MKTFEDDHQVIQYMCLESGKVYSRQKGKGSENAGYVWTDWHREYGISAAAYDDIPEYEYQADPEPDYSNDDFVADDKDIVG